MHTFLSTHLLLIHAQVMAAPAPTTDTTGTSDAILNLAKWGAGLVGSFLVLALVWQGIQYMLTHDLSRSVQLKIAAMGIVGGAIIAILAVAIGPEFYNLILGKA